MYNKTIVETFALYKRTDNDYYVKFNNEVMPTSVTIMLSNESDLMHKEDHVGVYKSEFIEKLHPDNIDSVEFWKMATDKFPLFSICGSGDFTNIEEVNITTLRLSLWCGALGPINELFEKKKTAKILEIGPGHGGFKNYIKSVFSDKNYYAIDVNPLFKHDRIYQTDGKTIPDVIPHKLDMIYSINVFQHLSNKQRTSYYKQSYDKLKKGGHFVFGMFVMTEENKNWPCWGTKGEDGRFYCNFFRQLTPIDTKEAVVAELESYGYRVKNITANEEKSHYLVFDCYKA